MFGKLYFMQAQLGGSRTEDADTVRTAPLWHLEFDRTGRAFGFNYRATGIGPGFESDAGFVPRSDVVNAHAFNRVSFYGAPGDLLEQVTLRGGLEGIWDYRDLGARGPTESGLDLEAVKGSLPHGEVTVEVVPGGMLVPNGLDDGGRICVVNAAISVAIGA